jgi:hypothetical protein
MSNSTIKQKAASKQSSVRYVRLPVDQSIDLLISKIQSENPFFSELDCIRYIMGKFATQNNYNIQTKTKLKQTFDNLVKIHSKTPKMSEQEIFDILQKNDLM